MTDAARTLPKLPRWKCHKVVEAAKILAIREIRDDGFDLALEVGAHGQGVIVHKDWMIRHQPVPGGYFVRYEDGYTSFSPAAAFVESGYRRLVETQASPRTHGVITDIEEPKGPWHAPEPSKPDSVDRSWPGPRTSVPDDLEHALASALNRHSAENGSNTPDFILANFLLYCLTGWNVAVHQREKWYDVRHEPGRGPIIDAKVSTVTEAAQQPGEKTQAADPVPEFVGGRRAGKTALQGRPLDDDGRIEFKRRDDSGLRIPGDAIGKPTGHELRGVGPVPPQGSAGYVNQATERVEKLSFQVKDDSKEAPHQPLHYRLQMADTPGKAFDLVRDLEREYRTAKR